MRCSLDFSQKKDFPQSNMLLSCARTPACSCSLEGHFPREVVTADSSAALYTVA
jgi:hypothetical protein